MTNLTPGASVTLAHLPNYPGIYDSWSETRPFFERAYSVAEEADLVVRLRFEPVQIEPAIDANVPLMPSHISVLASASSVDAAGAVILLNGRGLVRPARSFAQDVGVGADFDQDDFLLNVAKIQTEDLVAFKRQIASASLLILPAPAA